ncbi:MAG: hypothetical protein BGO25_01455 [Acidobacteriales bacterium 59-55]|nr:MAG: hypothetical protein BGO25_01455 [Acidobacteriales bacterium 59-55]
MRPASNSCLGTREWFAEYLLDVTNLTLETAGSTLAIIQGDIGEYTWSQFEHAAMTAEDHIKHLFGIALYHGVHGAELIGQAGVVNDGQSLGDDFLDAFPGTHGNYGKAGEHDYLLMTV